VSIHLPLGQCRELSIDCANDPIAVVVPGGVVAQVSPLDQ
jgi:hypothetical protein